MGTEKDTTHSGGKQGFMKPWRDEQTWNLEYEEREHMRMQMPTKRAKNGMWSGSKV
jgi:hypothetical protein